ncbi:MAG: phosphoribosylformylglycinamidine synthase [Bacteroidales bacterium]|nr:phosphoribosylformylglycinamidine synthase [Bacteroidales bacterium]
MVHFFSGKEQKVIALESKKKLNTSVIKRLSWLFSGAEYLTDQTIKGNFIGPRKEMITPWSTNAVEITQNMGIEGIERIEEFFLVDSSNPDHDPMLQHVYHKLEQNLFTINAVPEPIIYIDDIAYYNESEGLALSEEEVQYLDELSKKLGRKLTDSEIFGFSQVNSEHCRHKIFNGTFIIDGEEKKASLFQLIKLTTRQNPNQVISAYKDNCAFLQGPVIEQFSPETQDKPDYFKIKDIESVLSLKAETHNFPTTVEPFNGAATGTGGEIRDRLAGGKAALPLAGTAVYMTSYPRLSEERNWEKENQTRKWLYQTPSQILVKASNGASDFGNKFGQPLICGSVLTFEHTENDKFYGYDKVIMLAGGIGFGKKMDSEKGEPEKGDRIVLLGGDNYRIGMGGGAVSSVATGEYDNTIELNAVQRSNPEMQKRVCNAIRAMAELDENPIVSIHDHGAGGHLNCLSELIEKTGGKISLDKLPIGDPTLSAKEIVGNESQERMGLVIKEKNISLLKNVSDRERAPIYDIGAATGDHHFVFEDKHGKRPIDLKLEDMFGNPPKTIMVDSTASEKFKPVEYTSEKIYDYVNQVLQLEAVACKDWLTNKVDRSVTGKVAKQQTAGIIQLPLNNVAVSALDYSGYKGIATAIGHAPVSALIDPASGSILSIAEALTNIIWAPLTNGLKSVSLSANWMWPCKNNGEDARLYKAVEAASRFAIELGINIPTGKDSLSMTQKYPDGKVVFSPGTVIISAIAEVEDFRNIVEPVLKPIKGSSLLYIPFAELQFPLGGSSFAQVVNRLGSDTPNIEDTAYFVRVFNKMQKLIKAGKLLAGHDVSSGGLITSLLEMCFGRNDIGIDADLSSLLEGDSIKILFSEQPALLIQVENAYEIIKVLKQEDITAINIGSVIDKPILLIANVQIKYKLNIHSYRDVWYKTSFLLDSKQTARGLATDRYKNYKLQELQFEFPDKFNGKLIHYGIDLKRRISTGIKSAIIREKGVNGDREMAYSMYLAGMDVKDVHMTDLISGRETLEDINMIVFVGGFSNSDVLGSAKGWAGAFLYNDKARKSLEKFYLRKDTLSLGVCNGCQLMMELGLIVKNHNSKPYMSFNDSHKFESAFLNVNIPQNNSVMLHSLAGSRLGIWVAHGEGKFNLPKKEKEYNVALKYSYKKYPGNPNGSDYNVAGLCSADGRHLAVMPHLERSIFPWNWAAYPDERKKDEVSPWIEAFVNAREWIQKNS